MSQPAGPADLQTAPLRLCPACDYDLRGIDSPRCPECGMVIENALALLIAWEHGRRLGYMRAFFRTARVVLFKGKRFARAIDEPLNARAAECFRLIVTAIAGMGLATIVALYLWQTLRNDPFADMIERQTHEFLPQFWEPILLWAAGAAKFPVLPLGAVLSTWIATGAARIWLFSKRADSLRRRNAAILSSYTCVPLIFLPLSSIAYAAATGLESPGGYARFGLPIEVLPILFGTSGAIFFLILIVWWAVTVQFISRAIGGGIIRFAATAIGVPAGWAFAFAVGMGIWPCLIGLFRIAINSF